MAKRTVSVDFVRELLAPRRVSRLLSERQIDHISPQLAPRRSAVAAILHDGALGPEILLMQRAVRRGDPWSGQISMPGGMTEKTDADAIATAVRETIEEVGVDLDRTATRLGRLDDQVAIARGRKLGMAIAPFVFWVDDKPKLDLGPEAEAAFWLPVAPAINGDLDGFKEWRMAGITRKFPAWVVERYVVWGLTYGMLSKLFDVAGLARK